MPVEEETRSVATERLEDKGADERSRKDADLLLCGNASSSRGRAVERADGKGSGRRSREDELLLDCRT